MTIFSGCQNSTLNSYILNKDSKGNIRTRNDTSLAGHILYRKIRVVEAQKELTQMKTGKATGPNDIPIEAWKS